MRDEYLQWREDYARRLAKGQRFTARLRRGAETFLTEIDERSLRRCPSCEEITYPDPDETWGRADPHVAHRCHFCDGESLAEIETEAAAPT